MYSIFYTRPFSVVVLFTSEEGYMKIIKTILCPMILIACVAPIFAQQKESLPEFYDSEIIKVSYSFWGGMTLSVKGTTSTIGWKLSPIFSDLLNQYTPA